ncbi:hypothetical protein [Pseudomonas chlororaphis]|uniref:hypothetical protein n=1 Tax=Pseudomonas chlororaphis TaxID=587753 RepID=UPI002D79A47A|nr:hypothetical protein [Pseudomonas chlororaphis]
MFITNKKAEVKGSHAMLEPGHQGWHFVQQHLISPWFHTTIVRCEDGEEFHEVVFIDNLQALTSFLDVADMGVQVRSVRLVSPGWLNGAGDWRMEILQEVARNQEGTSWRYTLQNGRQYYFPDAPPQVPTTYCVQMFPKPQTDIE